MCISARAAAPAAHQRPTTASSSACARACLSGYASIASIHQAISDELVSAPPRLRNGTNRILSIGGYKHETRLTTRRLPTTHVLAMRACSSQPHKPKLLPHFDSCPRLPVWKKPISTSDDLTQNVSHSYNVILNCMKKAFEHRSILLVTSLEFSLPFRQAFWTISQLICCDHKMLAPLTC